jgi:hypothetical protein
MKASVMKRVGMANRSLGCFVVTTLCCQLQFLALAQEKKESYEKNPTYLKYHEQAVKGDVGAQENLGRFFYRAGIETKAVEWYKKAAGQNSSLATFQLAYIYSSVDLGSAEKALQKNGEATQHLQQAADALSKAQQKAADATEMTPVKRAGFQVQGTRQEEVKDKTQETQEDVLEIAPDAGRWLDIAAKQMQKVEEKLAYNEAEAAVESENAAIVALETARGLLQDEIDALKKAAKDKKTLEELNEDIGKLIEKQQKTQINTAKAAGQEQIKAPNSPNLADRIAKGAEEQAGASGKNRDQFKKPLDDELKKLAEEIRDERKEEPQGDQVEFDDQQAYKFWYILKELPSSSLKQKSDAEKFMLLLKDKKLKPEQIEAASKQAIEELKKMGVGK